MSNRQPRNLDAWVPYVAPLLVIGLVSWIVASATLGIPHGRGHSIESMTGIVALRDIAFPVWLGSFVGILAALALRAFRSLGSER